ncbi:quinoprotein relay system zinc metallohydrolase 2 [Fulvimarina manganoxydans]|uniref:Quinoprotein relay system zinc metallohydrolase 2 n=1 Tax=Fulvimarina manganoxydans TaxID=937218 RepID=A0A1W2DQA9_9HYPH|nr:quinoprotein relay system zinc metallohydrolase 2 [Fulvimarina manganoxydans]SMC99212.1 quinoprotein relay system zinc metallohydrolase 2 [Fulvimarina manganoxydans]
MINAWTAVVLAFVLWYDAAIALAADRVASFYSEVVPGVFVHEGEVAETSAANRGDIANIGFVVGDDAVAVIDTGGSVTEAQEALAAIRAITDKPIAYAINTHMHPDHLFGNQVFKAAGARIIGHERLAPALAARAESYRASMREQLGPELADAVTITPPDEGVSAERTLDLGNRPLVLKAWDTAHTDNDLTVFDERTRTLFAGDLVFMKHLPVLDGSLLGWLRQTPMLEAIPAERVVPGHGPATAPWPDAIEPQTAYLEALARDVRVAIASGQRLSETAETAAKAEAEAFELSEDYRRRNATAAYAELEWE